MPQHAAAHCQNWGGAIGAWPLQTQSRVVPRAIACGNDDNIHQSSSTHRSEAHNTPTPSARSVRQARGAAGVRDVISVQTSVRHYTLHIAHCTLHIACSNDTTIHHLLV